MNLVTAELARLQRKKFLAELLAMGCAILALGWIGAALVLVIGNAESRPHIFRILSYLWLWLAVAPLCVFGVCWGWRSSLKRKIGEIPHGTKKDA